MKDKKINESIKNERNNEIFNLHHYYDHEMRLRAQEQISADIRAEMKAIREDMRSEFKAVREDMKEMFKIMDNRLWSLNNKILGLYGAGAAIVIGAWLRSHGWFI